MQKIEKNFLDREDFGLVSITINPKYDTPQVLNEHAEHLGIKHKNYKI